MKASKNTRLIVTLIVLILFIGYFAANTSKFRPLLDLNLLLLLIIAIGDMAGIFINGLFTRFILRPFKKHISLGESFYVSLISSVGNFFAPVGAGFGFRAVYLKKKFGLPYSEYISTLSGNYIIVFLVNSLAGLLALYLLRSRSDAQYKVLALAFGIVFVVSLTLSLIKVPISAANEQKVGAVRKFVRQLARVTEGWNHIVSHRLLMLQLIGLTTTNLILTMGITLTIIHSLHFNIALAPLLLFSVLGSLSLFINVTPANLGIKEAIYLFSSHVLGFSTSQILSIALVDRGVMFILLALLWVASHRMSGPAKDLRTADA
ncbi:MAG TPA: lysylphosphatidylglycerol synthase transmembrane domain-containing protein [Candidatus Saccharimonadales bacterium]|nr:lysylphosphatidylglycerol synthase transmembrane domain-containing protein [Candidatus Saccharimonadales bacterium]